MIGNALEWYDFIVYGFLSSLIARLFFPSGDEYTSLLMARPPSVSVSSCVRSVGSCSACMPTAGGRKAAMQLIILLMTLSIAMIAFAPTYAAIGVGAPLLIVIARMLQGFATGGEYASATAFRWRARRRTGAVSTVPGNCSASAWRCSPVRGWARWSPIAWTPRPGELGLAGAVPVRSADRSGGIVDPPLHGRDRGLPRSHPGSRRAPGAARRAARTTGAACW
ncbi:MFS transporter [Pseudomonas aeruginosa]|nr:MFS transporter [Pseudomonas aeruginosa]